jgi:hypothetical protein
MEEIKNKKICQFLKIEFHQKTREDSLAIFFVFNQENEKMASGYLIKNYLKKKPEDLRKLFIDFAIDFLSKCHLRNQEHLIKKMLNVAKPFHHFSLSNIKNEQLIEILKTI